MTRTSDSPRKRFTDAPAVDVGLAFGLGWDMTYLFTVAGRGEPKREDLPDRLPSVSRLPEKERLLIRLDRIRGPARRFKPLFKAANAADIPSVKEVEKAIRQEQGREAICASMKSLHFCLLRGLSAADTRLAKAYRLGRSLATTCHVPTDRQSLELEFNPHRLARLGEWLADLASLLPPHSSRPVRLSISSWRRWIENPRIDPASTGEQEDGGGRIDWLRRRARSLRPEERELDWKIDGNGVCNTLERQGVIWRALLSGEKRAEEMLEPAGYVRAARKVVPRTAQTLKGLRTPLVLLALIACIGVVAIASDDGAEKTFLGIAAVVVAFASAIGLTWKSPLRTLGQLTNELNQPLWGGLLDEEIATAITEKPPGAIFHPDEPEIAAPAAGPTPDTCATPSGEKVGLAPLGQPGCGRQM